jgi:hypothetical protein
VRVATPSGKVGYVQDDTISTLYSDRVCFLKDAADVHAAAQPSSPVLEKVGSVLVRIMPDGPLPGAGDALPERPR